MFRMFIKIYLWTNVTFDFKEKWLISDRSGCGTSFCWFRNKASNADHNPVNISNISHLLPPLFTFQGWHNHRSCFNRMLCQIQISTSHYHQYPQEKKGDNCNLLYGYTAVCLNPKNEYRPWKLHQHHDRWSKAQRCAWVGPFQQSALRLLFRTRAALQALTQSSLNRFPAPPTCNASIIIQTHLFIHSFRTTCKFSIPAAVIETANIEAKCLGIEFSRFAHILHVHDCICKVGIQTCSNGSHGCNSNLKP